MSRADPQPLTDDAATSTPADEHPSPPDSAAAGAADTDPRSPLYFNCSGKHAAFLAAARASGADTSTYLDPAHPVQKRVAEVVEAFAAETPAAMGIDGCGAPVFALSLTGLARAIGRMVRSDGAGVGTAGAGAADVGSAGEKWGAFASEARTLMDAVFADPWAIEGHGRPNSTVIERLGVFAKGGAEGVIVMATKSGYSVAVKCLDGSSRATGFVALSLLQRAGSFAEPADASAEGATLAVQDGAGTVSEEDIAATIAAITDPVTGGTDSEGWNSVVGALELGEDIALSGERKWD